MSRTKAEPRPHFQFVLDLESGVPIYRQIINQVMGGIATGALAGGDQLPTVRQLSVDLAVNPNTVVRAYRELEIRGVLETQQGTGTFITPPEAGPNANERRRQLRQLVSEFVTRANGSGFTVKELLEEFGAIDAGSEDRRR
jgi:GntR family transcriptional regulator